MYLQKKMLKNFKVIIRNLFIPKQQNVVLGRWKLKHNNELFYNPDPGYPNNYLKK